MKEWYWKNLERARAIKRASAKKQYDKNPDACLARLRRYREKDLEAFLEMKREISRRYRKNHPDRVRVQYDKRRALRKGASTGEVVDRNEVYIRDGGKCHICGAKVSKHSFSIDHLIPLSKGGEHSYQNVALAHFSCNASRGAGRLPAQLRLVG